MNVFQEGALDLLLNKRNLRGKMRKASSRARPFIYFEGKRDDSDQSHLIDG